MLSHVGARTREQDVREYVRAYTTAEHNAFHEFATELFEEHGLEASLVLCHHDRYPAETLASLDISFKYRAEAANVKALRKFGSHEAAGYLEHLAEVNEVEGEVLANYYAGLIMYTPQLAEELGIHPAAVAAQQQHRDMVFTRIFETPWDAAVRLKLHMGALKESLATSRILHSIAQNSEVGPFYGVIPIAKPIGDEIIDTLTAYETERLERTFFS